MARQDHRGRKRYVGDSFVQVLRATLKEPAWQDMTYGARCLYIALKAHYVGDNNGRVFLGVRRAANELGANRESTARWFRELEDHGFIVQTERGVLGVEGKGMAACWRLTELGCMGQQPTRDYKKWASDKNKTLSGKSSQGGRKIQPERTENPATELENPATFGT